MNFVQLLQRIDSIPTGKQERQVKDNVYPGRRSLCWEKTSTKKSYFAMVLKALLSIMKSMWPLWFDEVEDLWFWIYDATTIKKNNNKRRRWIQIQIIDVFPTSRRFLHTGNVREGLQVARVPPAWCQDQGPWSRLIVFKHFGIEVCFFTRLTSFRLCFRRDMWRWLTWTELGTLWKSAYEHSLP